MKFPMKINQSPTMAKIITVTANTAIDFIVKVGTLSLGDNVVAANSLEFASGKGINVAKAIESLAGQVTALGFVGDQSHAFFNGINSEWLVADFTLVEGKTRTNITLSDIQTNTETHVRTSGFTVTVADCNNLVEKISGHLVTGDLVILSGSLPDGEAQHLYATIIDLCRKQSVRVFLDTSGASLIQGVQTIPDLIKPNQQEFEELTGRKFSDAKSMVHAAREIIHQGIEWVIVSRGEKGAVFIDANVAFSASVDVKEFGPPVTRVGCGDALLGGFAWAQLQGQGLRDVIVTGVSCGAANLFSAEPGRFDQKMFLQIKEEVLIRSI
jgi:1-phosphofructokinase family hexose kinase